MQTKTVKFNSFKSLANLVNHESTNTEKWNEFLLIKGHTKETFSYLPEYIQLSLKVSFAKKQI